MINRKNQRKSLVLLAIAAIVAIEFSGCGKDCYECQVFTTEELSITDKITGIIIDGPWDVTITQEDTDNSAVLDYCVSEKSKVSARLLSNGYLHIRVSTRRNVHHNDFRATIQAASLKKIEASGAASIRTYGHFCSLENISLSGASAVNGLSGEGFFAKIKLSGASTLKDFSFDGNSINADISGASNANFDNLNLEYCKVDCSGASVFAVRKAYVPECLFIGSGASSFKTRNLESENLVIHLSGASTAEVTVNNTITGSLTGASMLKYRKAVNVSGVSTSGASKISRLD